jgi:hypothetical protein
MENCLSSKAAWSHSTTVGNLICKREPDQHSVPGWRDFAMRKLP